MDDEHSNSRGLWRVACFASPISRCSRGLAQGLSQGDATSCLGQMMLGCLNMSEHSCSKAPDACDASIMTSIICMFIYFNIPPKVHLVDTWSGSVRYGPSKPLETPKMDGDGDGCVLIG